jgi:hypothetical protein
MGSQYGTIVGTLTLNFDEMSTTKQCDFFLIDGKKAFTPSLIGYKMGTSKGITTTL